MTGYRDGHMAVEFYKGSWVLRAALPGDLPAHIHPPAAQAMALWRTSNQQKFHEPA